ncbi:histone H3 [Cercospora beticola]|uniref:Histone H3 n=1 Tax=Cercospora beticola TaxID=122368 RepID=A0A2G5I0N6_CERBT|nr:histone H3 [Cercospora beticola]PIA98062.1 histone H3 [Cercospora beticola]WPA98793.1 hypothetical protein RHO25_003406 [Cercospora beticola]CAK1360074.1 unnamed protein product [Cercospora beticola]
MARKKKIKLSQLPSQSGGTIAYRVHRGGATRGGRSAGAGRGGKSTSPSTRPQPAAAAAKEEKKKRRPAPSTITLQKIKKYQESTHLLILSLPFQRLVREIANELIPSGERGAWRWQKSAVIALQEAAEAYLVSVLKDTNILALHAKRTTITQKDMQLQKRLVRDRA